VRPVPVLRVDPDDTEEISRFWSYVVRGPRAADCWLWTGAIADGAQQVVRPHRYAYALAHDAVLTEQDVIRHACDVPICCRVVGEHTTDHLLFGSSADNAADMAARGRGGGQWWQWRWRGTDRRSRVQRSRALAAAVRDGWDPERIRVALDSVGGYQPTLF
jgi:hypothetical protein